MTNVRSPRSPVSTRPARRSASPTTTSRARSTRARPSASTGAPPSSSTSTSRSRTYYSSSNSSRWAAAARSADKQDGLEPLGALAGSARGETEARSVLIVGRKHGREEQIRHARWAGSCDVRLPTKDHFWKPVHPLLETLGMESSNCTNAERGTAKVAAAHCF